MVSTSLPRSVWGSRSLVATLPRRAAFRGSEFVTETRQLGEPLRRRESIGPFHLEDVLRRRWVESCDESRDAIAALESPNHIYSFGRRPSGCSDWGSYSISFSFQFPLQCPVVPVQAGPNWRLKDWQLIGRRYGKSGGAVALSDSFSAFGDGPGFAACPTAHVDDRSSQRIRLGGDRVAAWARKETSGFGGIDWSFVHDSSTMPQPRLLHNHRTTGNSGESEGQRPLG